MKKGLSAPGSGKKASSSSRKKDDEALFGETPERLDGLVGAGDDKHHGENGPGKDVDDVSMGDLDDHEKGLGDAADGGAGGDGSDGSEEEEDEEAVVTLKDVAEELGITAPKDKVREKLREWEAAKKIPVRADGASAWKWHKKDAEKVEDALAMEFVTTDSAYGYGAGAGAGGKKKSAAAAGKKANKKDAKSASKKALSMKNNGPGGLGGQTKKSDEKHEKGNRNSAGGTSSSSKQNQVAASSSKQNADDHEVEELEVEIKVLQKLQKMLRENEKQAELKMKKARGGA